MWGLVRNARQSLSVCAVLLVSLGRFSSAASITPNSRPQVCPKGASGHLGKWQSQGDVVWAGTRAIASALRGESPLGGSGGREGRVCVPAACDPLVPCEAAAHR